MSRFRIQQGVVSGLALVILLLAAGCSSPTGLNGTEGDAGTDSGQVPFREAEGKATAGSNAPAVSTVSEKAAKSESSLPFRDPDNLPAGTLLTVRLKGTVSADNLGASGRFEGVIDEPVTVDGNMLIPRGASVAGRVESVRSSKVKGSGFVRVTLDSIDIAGKDLRLQTSSLFARGNGAGDSATVDAITLEKGRRLTFRLTETASVVQTTPPNR